MSLLSVSDTTAKRRSARVTVASLSRLRLDNIAHEEIREGQFHVAGAFQFWPATGYWRSDDCRARGYGVGALIALAKAAAT